MLLDYAQRLMRLAEEADSAVRDLRDLQRGRVLVGANEAAVHVLLPLLEHFRRQFPRIQIDIRRVPSRQIGVEVLQRSLDFGILSFPPAERGLGVDHAGLGRAGDADGAGAPAGRRASR